MNKIIICFFLLFGCNSYSQTIKLNYSPKGKIIKFTLNHLTILSDTSALFNITDYKSSNVIDSNYAEKIRHLIASKLDYDTIEINEPFVNFNDTSKYPNETHWRIWYSIRTLTMQNKVSIIDSNGNYVKIIKVVSKGKKDSCNARKVFIDKQTKKELFNYEFSKIICLGILYEY